MLQRLNLPAVCICGVVAVFTVVSSAQAQYCGRSKVQHKELTFEVLSTEHFDIYFYAEERDATEDVARMAERWHARLSRLLRHSLRRQPIVLYASHPDFQQTNVVTGEIGEGTGGVTEGLKNRVVLPLTGALAETDHVLGHELVHAFQYDIACQREAGEGNPGGSLQRLPLWFVEGMAEYLSIGPVDSHTAMWLTTPQGTRTCPISTGSTMRVTFRTDGGRRSGRTPRADGATVWCATFSMRPCNQALRVPWSW